MAKPDLLKWVSDDDANKITDPGSSKKLAGFLYKEKPPFQYLNWFFNQIFKWFRGLQGNYYDVIIGSAAQVTALEATNVIGDINDTLVPTGTKVLILDGTHLLTANIVLAGNFIEIYCERHTALIDLDFTYKIVFNNFGIRGELVFVNAAAISLEVNNISSIIRVYNLQPNAIIVASGSTVIASHGILSDSVLVRTEITTPDANGDININSKGTGKVLINGKQQGFRGCLVKPTVVFSVPDSTDSWIPFDDEEYDTDGIHDTVTNNDRLTVPAGVTKVKITGHIQFSSTSTVGRRTLEIVKNTSTIPSGVSLENKAASAAGTTPCNVFSATLEVTGGDYFRLRARQDSGISLNTFTTSWFAMEIIE